MDLKDFVSQTLIQIVEGVKEAESIVHIDGAIVNPPFAGDAKNIPRSGVYHTGMGGLAQLVEFDAALTVTDETETKGGIGIFGGVVNLGSSGESANTNVSVSRVKFLVPLALSRR
jgi:hypothetical protein